MVFIAPNNKNKEHHHHQNRHLYCSIRDSSSIMIHRNEIDEDVVEDEKLSLTKMPRSNGWMDRFDSNVDGTSTETSSRKSARGESLNSTTTKTTTMTMTSDDSTLAIFVNHTNDDDVMVMMTPMMIMIQKEFL
jgi:hypothetical protein